MTHPPGQATAAGAATITAERRQAMIAEAACLRAQSRGFAPGSRLDDGLEAEGSVDEHLAERAFDAPAAAD